MDVLREDFLGPPHDTTPVAVIANKNKTEILEFVFIRDTMFFIVTSKNEEYPTKSVCDRVLTRFSPLQLHVIGLSVIEI